jgi:hypothetical protein
MEAKGNGADVCGSTAPLELNPEEFRPLGYGVIDSIAEFLKSLSSRPVIPNETATSISRVDFTAFSGTRGGCRPAA